MSLRKLSKIITGVLVFALIIVMSSVEGLAKTSNIAEVKLVDKTIVNITDEAADIPENMIESIVKDYPNAGKITISGWGSSSNITEIDAVSQTPDISPLSFYYYTYVTNKAVTQANATAKTEFQFSVAKGEQTTLTRDYSGSLTGSFTGYPFSSGLLGVTGTITGMYSKSTTYSGPPEGSVYNSRSFYLRFFEDRGNWTQIRYMHDANTGAVLGSSTTNGTYKKATEWAKYSIDNYYY